MSDQSNVSLSALPLKAYDFFSIVFPGVSVLLSAYFFEELYLASQSSGQSGLPVHWLMNETWRNASNASTQAAVVGISMCIIYLAGQLVSSIANFFLDRIFVYKCYGYPFEHLLFDSPKDGIFVDHFSRRFYRGSIFWLHVALASFAWHEIHNTSMTLAWICIGVFFSALSLHLLSQIFHGKPPKFEAILKRLIDYYAMPYKILINPIQKINQSGKPMQKHLSAQYKTLFKQDFQMNPETAESDNYWFALFYVRQKDPRMSSLIHRWHQTAIFARNMAASFYMAFCYSTIILWYEISWKRHLIQEPNNFRITFALSGLFVLAIFLSIRFYYFYVSYYSKCLYRAFVFLHFNNDTKPTSD